MSFEMYLINAYRGEMILFPPNCPFGNLDMKYNFIFSRLNLLNETITEIHRVHTINYEKRKNAEGFSGDEFFLPIALGMRFSSELKILTDEMISLNYIAEYFRNKREWPNKIDIDCIGRLLESKNPIEGFAPFYKDPQLLTDINGIGNAVKHSFVNTNIIFLRNYEDMTTRLYAIYQKNNDQKNDKNLMIIEMPKLVLRFNKLIDEYKTHLKSNYSQYVLNNVKP